MSNRGHWKIDQATGQLVEYKPEPRPLTTMIITDSMEPTRHMANGKTYDSKSAFRRVTKLHGYEEVGSIEDSYEHNPKPDPKYDEELEHDTREAIRQLEWNEAPRVPTRPPE